MEKVSIIMPVYNRAGRLQKSITSIINQTYVNKQIIIVDDGSTDNTLQILREISDIYPELTVISTINKGPGSARNTGLKQANGEYIMFIDSDDIFFDDRTIENAIFAMTESNSDLLISNFKSQNYLMKKGINSDYNINIHSQKEVILTIMFSNLFNPIWNKVYKNSIIRANNIQFPESFMGEDLVFNLEYIKYCKSLRLYNSELIIYNTNSKDNLTSKYFSDTFDIRKTNLLKVKEILIYLNLDLKSYYIAYIRMAIASLRHQFKRNSLNNSYGLKKKYFKTITKDTELQNIIHLELKLNFIDRIYKNIIKYQLSNIILIILYIDSLINNVLKGK